MILSRGLLKKGLLIIGLIIGLIHLKVGLKAMFVMTEKNHISLIFLILLGPLLTLPAVTLSYFRPKIGGILLISGGIISLIIIPVFGVEAFNLKEAFSYVIRYLIPMLILGCGVLYLNKSSIVR